MVGILLVTLVFLTSWMYRETSLAGTGSGREAAERAARVGDYQTAQALWEEERSIVTRGDVLGVDLALEELVYPDKKTERTIARYEELNAAYPGHRDILVALSKLYRKLGKGEQADSYWELARILDPNNPIFQP